MNSDTNPAPHSREWYNAMNGDYAHPWQQELLEVSGETLFDALLSRHLSPARNVLEAGCAGGCDAAVYAPRAKRWTGYDFAPQFLETARGKGIPNASFVDWHSSREPIPAAIFGAAPFDLIVSRRGPTSVIQHLPVLATLNASFLYVGPRGADLLEEIRVKLEGVAWRIVWSVVIEAHGFLPSFEDYVLYAEFGNQPVSRTEFESRATDHGFPFLETKCVIVAHPT